MTPDRYLVILREYDALLEYAKAISGKLVNTQLEEPHLKYAGAIFTKLICHAISLRKLSPSSGTPEVPELWDLASASAVARSLIEAFDALAYISLHVVTPSEREFRVLLWQLHDQQRRCGVLKRIGSIKPQAVEICANADKLLVTLKAHPFYIETNNDFKSKIQRDDAPPMHLSRKELSAASAVDHDHYINATVFLSQYVHTLPMSVHQLMSFRADDPESLRLCSLPLQHSMGFLAKSVVGMLALFPHGYLAPPADVEDVMTKWLYAVGIKE